MEDYIPISGKTYSLFGKNSTTQPFYQAVQALTSELLLWYPGTQELFLEFIQLKSRNRRNLRRSSRSISNSSRSISWNEKIPEDSSELSYILNRSHNDLSVFLGDVEQHNKLVSIRKRLNDRSILTIREQYYLYMIEFELVNRIYSGRFRDADFKLARQAAMDTALEVVEAVQTEFMEQFGRQYHILDCYRHEDAEIILVTAGTIGSTARVAVDELREDGQKVGLVRIRLFRPFPKAALIKTLKHARRIAVIDRNISPGQEGVFSDELKSALYSRVQHVPVFSFVLGLGGTNVSPTHIKKVIQITSEMDEPPLSPISNIEDDDDIRSKS